MTSPPPPETRLSADPGTLAPEVRAARAAVFAVFIASGFAFASWVSRIPDIRDQLQAAPSTLGLVLLAVAAGSLIAMPLAGIVVTRIGAARSVAHHVADLVGRAGRGRRSATGTASRRSSPDCSSIGFGNGTWDVAMNVEGAAVEQRLRTGDHAQVPRRLQRRHGRRSPRWDRHGGAGRAGHRPPDRRRRPGRRRRALSTRSFLPGPSTGSRNRGPGLRSRRGTNRHPLKAWTEPRTLLIGVFVLCMAFTEGTGNDWLAVAVIDGYQAAPVLGPLALAVFLAAMTDGALVRTRADRPLRPRGDRAVVGPGRPDRTAADRLRHLSADRLPRVRCCSGSAPRSASPSA